MKKIVSPGERYTGGGLRIRTSYSQAQCVQEGGGMSGYCCPVARPVTGPEAWGLGELSESHTIYVNWGRGRHRRTRLSLSTENPKGVRTSI